MTLPALRAISTDGITGSGTSLNMPLPTRQAGDILVAEIAWSGGGTLTPPAGWTRIDGGGIANFALCWALQDVVAVNFTISVSGVIVGRSASYSGVNNASPFTAAATNTGTGTAAVASAVTTDRQNSLLIVAFATSVGSTFSTPSGMTERADANSMAICDEIVSAIGTTGTRTSTASGSGNWGAITAAFRSVPAAPHVNNQALASKLGALVS